MLNLFSIGGAGLLQFLSGRMYSATLGGPLASGPYVAVFALFTVCLIFGFVIYLFSKDAPA